MDAHERERLGSSRDPRDWVLAFEADCEAAASREISYVRLANVLVMMGPGPAMEGEDEIRAEILTAVPDYDSRILGALRARPGLVGKVRRVLRDDLRTDGGVKGAPGEYGRISLKSYARWLLDEFLSLEEGSR